MSRIGRKAVVIPGGVTVEKRDAEIRVRGPRGELAVMIPQGVTADVADGKVSFARVDDRKPTRSLHGLARAQVANMVTGVTEGFRRELSIEGVGYRAEVSGGALTLTLGFSHPVVMPIPPDLKVAVERNTVIRIEGVDRHVVGQFAANVRKVRPPEPYKGKGIRYAGERVRRKVGKAGAV